MLGSQGDEVSRPVVTMRSPGRRTAAAPDYFVGSAGERNASCSAFYRKNMTEEVTSLSPEPVTGFILSRRWFRLSDYRLLK